MIVRRALASDLEAIVGLYAEDELGSHRDEWSEKSEPEYRQAFNAIEADPTQHLFVAEAEGEIVGTFLLCFLQGLRGRGSLAALLRSVQVRNDHRSEGIGARMIAYAEQIARERGAVKIELTSSLRREDAHRFYLREGYVRSHAGFTKSLG